MNSPFEKPENPWKPFIVAALMDAILVVAGFFMYLRTDSIWWLIGGVVAGSLVLTPASMKLVAVLRKRGEFE